MVICLTSIQFNYSFKKIFSINFYASKTGNCERDNEMLSVTVNFVAYNKTYTEDDINEDESIDLYDDDFHEMDISK